LCSAVVHTISQVLVPALATIYDTAVSAGLTTLASLLTTAGLANTFRAAGTYTVFAPTNAAFGAIPAPLVDWLTNGRAINRAALVNTLSFHALSSAVNAVAIPAGGVNLTTLSLCPTCLPWLNASNVGGVVTVRSSTGTVLATVTTADVACTNGVVHVVSSVLVPSNKGIPTLDVVQTAQGVPTLSTLVTNLGTAGLVPALTIGPSTQSFTVFAPLNSGWSGVPASVSGNNALLSSVLTHHVIVGRVYAENLPVGVPVVRATLGGQALSLLRSANGTVAITSARDDRDW